MNKNKTYILIISFLAVAGLSFYLGTIFQGDSLLKTTENKFVGLEKNLTEFSEDTDFYRYLDLYTTLSNEEDYQYVKEAVERFEELEEIPDFIILILVNELFKDEKVKTILNNLKDEVYAEIKKELTKEEEDELFEKNTACANLITGITEQLASKYPEENKWSRYTTTKDEEFEFIFYSPTMKNCLYSTKYSYDYSDHDSYKDSYNTNSKRIYNVSSKTQLEEFTTYYSYNYPYLDDEERADETDKNKKGYAKFILENSNYNIDLIKDLSLYFW